MPADRSADEQRSTSLGVKSRRRLLPCLHESLSDPALSQGVPVRRGPSDRVARPGTLVEMWRTLKLCTKADKIIILQAVNAGITGGSTPDGDTYDREIVIVSGMRLDIIHSIKGGEQVICLPGSTLFHLEKLLKPLRREPHSVIGLSGIGASVFGGVCNNSGGVLIYRGPASRQTTLYTHIDEAGQVDLVNHLGIKIAGDEETVLQAVQLGALIPLRSRTTEAGIHRITTTSSMSARSTRIRRRASTPTLSACSRHRAAPARSCCWPCAWIRSP